MPECRGTVTLTESDVSENGAGSSGGGIDNSTGRSVRLTERSSVTGNKPDECFGTDAC